MVPLSPSRYIDRTGNGNLSTSDVWLANGTNIQVVATPSNYFFFGRWQGQTNGCTIASNRITVVMNSGRAIAAVFSPYLATNNVPKWWLAQFGLTNFYSDATNDIDRDSFFTWQEYIAGSDPTNPLSFFCLTGLGPGTQGIVLRWPSISSRFYSVSCSTDALQSTSAYVGIPGASNLPATPAENSYTDTMQRVRPCFFRIHVRE